MRSIIRTSLWFLLLNMLLVGFWAQFLPASFYQHFPGLTWAWLSADGPYNEHLLRDVGGLNLAIAVVTLLALLEPSSGLLRATALGSLVYQVPHTIYHVVHINLLLSTPQQIFQVLILSLGIIASLIILWGSRKTAFLKA
jgi:hypothetical protein